MQTATDLCDLRAAGAQEENISHERILFWRVLLQNFLTACKAILCAWCPGLLGKWPPHGGQESKRDTALRASPWGSGKSRPLSSLGNGSGIPDGSFLPSSYSQTFPCAHTLTHTAYYCQPGFPAVPPQLTWGLVELDVYPAEQCSVPHTRCTRT